MKHCEKSVGAAPLLVLGMLLGAGIAATYFNAKPQIRTLPVPRKPKATDDEAPLFI